MTSPDVLGSGGRAADPAPEKAPALPTGRNIELVLLAFAAAIVTAALVLVEANQENELTRALLYVGAAYLGLFTVAHFAVRKLAPYADPVMLPCVALLNGLGLVMIHRLDLAAADRAVALGREAPTVLIQRQVAWTAIGLALFVGVLYFVRNHRTLARYGYTAGFAGLVLLALPGLLPSSISEVNGAQIWLRLGIFSIQPGEFAKILLIVFFSVFLMQKRELFSEAGRTFLGMEFPRARDLAPLLIAWGLSVGVLVLERDLGTSLLFFGIVLVLLYTATNKVVVDGHRAVDLPGRRLRGLPALRPRAHAGARSGWTRSPTSTDRATSSGRRCSGWAPAGSAAPGWVRAARTSCPTPRATSCSPRSARSWAWSGWPRSSSSTSC